ncbi:hypothetical protein L2E82_07578 [Cichorium intybus]|uniref:Uncharacterized protein n=1 Tax=Cichorium intybus TaxID=13427 RepID=A0ACB9G6E2_CICIN|nr:hypothetical protein L2E82_07578 [Cichorium intybus]
MFLCLHLLYGMKILFRRRTSFVDTSVLFENLIIDVEYSHLLNSLIWKFEMSRGRQLLFKREYSVQQFLYHNP